jgi:hypothetical protein
MVPCTTYMGGPDNLHPKLPFLVHARYPMAALYYTSQLGGELF